MGQPHCCNLVVAALQLHVRWAGGHQAAANPQLTGGCVQMFCRHCTVPVRSGALTQHSFTLLHACPIVLHLRSMCGTGAGHG